MAEVTIKTKNGIQTRTNAKNQKTYRANVKVGGKLEWSPTFKTRPEAVSWRNKANGEKEAGTRVTPSAVTLRQAWEEFIAAAEAGTITSRSRKPFKPATLRGYRRGWAKIDPELGAHRLTSIKRADVQALVDTWASVGMLDKSGVRQPVKPSTIRNTLDPLRVIYRRAMQRDQIAVDPTERLEVPADHDGEPMRFASKVEAAELIAALPDGERPLWTTVMYAGLRRGELRALRWSDIDLASKTIHVTRNWDDVEGEITPKTKGSNRRVAIVPAVADALTEHKRQTRRSGSDLVFGRTDSDPYIPTTIRSRALRAWEAANKTKAKKLGRDLKDGESLAPITLHQCRHTFASLMIAAGCNAKALSVVMGHASITITFDRYGHLMPGGEQEVGRLLGEFLAK